MKYGQRILKQATELARKGLIDIELAKALGINIRTLYEWKNKYPQFSTVLSEAKQQADMRIENALFKSAEGIETTETHEHIRRDGSKEIKEIKKIKKTIMPNPTSLIFWLKNRQPDRWRDRREDLIAMVSKDDLQKSAAEINKIISNLKENAGEQ